MQSGVAQMAHVFPRTVVAVLALAMMAGSAMAQTPSARQLELAKRYVAAIDMQDNYERTMQAMLPVLQAQMAQSGKLTPEQQAKLAQITLEVSGKMVTKMLAKMPTIMAEVFTEAELEGLVRFYESPVGKSLIAKTPEMSAKIAPLMPELMAEMRTEMMSRVCEIATCPAAPGTVDSKAKPS